MKKLLILTHIILFSSCLHNGPLLKEKGIVLEKQFVPEFNGNGFGTGIGSNGNVVINNTTVHANEQYILVFKCEHGVLFSENNKQLYYELEAKDSVIIEYNEQLNSDNIVEGYHFIYAYKNQQP